jgi:dTDP-4-dehydrorhamnose reductase
VRVLIFGASGMLGSTLFRYLSRDKHLTVFGTVRSKACEKFFPKAHIQNLISDIDIENTYSVAYAFMKAEPEIVINCIGLVKQLIGELKALKVITINAQFPHQLAAFCKLNKSRLIHISTDCVFSGNKGNYSENDFPDPTDLYGQSKLLGEVNNENHVLTIRTSIIGHELESKKGLLEWFLMQEKSAKGFYHAFFSGLPTIELSKVIKNYLFSKALTGIYHVGATPISKHDLLCLIAKVYAKPIAILKDESVVINRSLNVSKCAHESGYLAPTWSTLVESMYEDYERSIVCHA